MTRTTPVPDVAAGTCLSCGHVSAAAATTGGVKTCSGCGERVALTLVRGEHSERQPCDDRCQYAIGTFCSCSCGGDNHRAGYIHEDLVPAWVRERDAARHTARGQRAAGNAAAKRERAAAGMAALLAEVPELEGLFDARYDNASGFATDMRAALEGGEMSVRQIRAAVDMIERDEKRIRARAEREQAQDAARAAGVTVPVGRRVVTGVITAVKDQVGYAGDVKYRLIVRSDEGWSMMGSLPTSLRTGADGFMIYGFQETFPGRRVTLTVTLDGPGERDQLFGFYSRPTKAAFID